MTEEKGKSERRAQFMDVRALETPAIHSPSILLPSCIVFMSFRAQNRSNDLVALLSN